MPRDPGNYAPLISVDGAPMTVYADDIIGVPRDDLTGPAFRLGDDASMMSTTPSTGPCRETGRHAVPDCGPILQSDSPRPDARAPVGHNHP